MNVSDSRSYQYQPPAIESRVAVGDPLIVGYIIVSPRWRPADPKPADE